MTNEQLDTIEKRLASEEEPDQMEWIEIVEALCAEVRRLKKIAGE